MRGVARLIGSAMVMAVVLAACSATPSGPAGENTGTEKEFAGPWADLFESTYAEATSDDERAALEDGEITAEEYVFFQGQIVSCLEGLGLTAQFQGDGALEYSMRDDVDPDAVRACNADNGIRVIALRDAIARNPTHLDETTIMLDCLRRTGVVGDGYTRADLENGVDLAELGTLPDFAGCAADPLHYEVD